MKKSASILDYSYPFLDPAVWDHEQKLYSYHKDFILRLLEKMYVNYKLVQPEAWITDIRIIGSLTTSKWLFTSDMDVHMIVNLTKFIELNMPGTDPKVAYEFLDNTRKEFDRAKILAPMTQHPIEYYFEVPEFITTNTSMVGVYSISQDAWLKAPVIFDADVDFAESKKQVMTEAESIAQALDGSFGKIDRQIDRITELETVIGTWGPDKQQLFYNKIEEKLKGIEAEIMKDLELRQALIDARHAAQDPMADIEIKFKWLQRFGFFGILSNLKELMKGTGGQVTLQELPLLKKIVTDSSLKEAFLKEALEKETETDICVDLDKTIAKPAKHPAIGEPIEGAKEALKKLQELGYNVVVYSCRGDEEGGVDLIKEYLDKHDIPYDSIFHGNKPFAKFYIDDRAIQFDNWDNVLKQVEKSEKKASLSVTARLNDKYWIDPSGKEYPLNGLAHNEWVLDNILNQAYDTPEQASLAADDKASEMISSGWTRITTETDYDFAMEVADLSNLPPYLDNFVAQHYTGGGVEVDDLSGEYQDLSDPFPSLRKAIYQARRLRNAASKIFSKRDIKAHKYDILGDPSLRQGQPRAVFNFVQKGVPEFGLPDLDMFDVLGDHPRYGSTLNRKEIEQLNIPITEDKVAKQAKTKKVKQGEYSCIMASIPHGIAQEIVEFGVREIPDEDLYTDEDGNLGRELQAHVTIMYGLLTDDAKSVRRSFNHTKPFKAKLGKVRHFQPPERDFDVVTVEVISDDLHAANAMIEDKFKCADDLPSSGEYKPHVTVAYVKRNAAKKHIGSDEFEGIEIELDTLVFSPRVGNKTHFSIGSNKKHASMDLGYWVDPKGKIYDAHGEGLIHNEWVLANLSLLRDGYGIKVPDDLYEYSDEYFRILQEEDVDNLDMPASDEIWNQMIQSGWVRVGDADEGIGIEVNDLHKIPPFIEGILAEDLRDGLFVRVEDINHNMISVQYPFKNLQQAVNRELAGQSKQADFLPSLTTQAPDNDWQFASGGDDKEIALDPDSVSDETTFDAPCTVGKPRTKEVWRQFISMFSNLFSKNDTQKIEAYDRELEEKEKDALGEDQTALEYAKDFKDLNGPGKPHNTTWDSLEQDMTPSKPLPVTYSPQISNEDNLDQNSPGGYPRRFMGKPKGEWFSNEGEVNNSLIQMLRNRTAMIEATTEDITKTAITKNYAVYVNNVAYPAVRTLTRGKAIRILKERFPEAYAKGLYEIREEEFKTSSLNKDAFNANGTNVTKNPTAQQIDALVKKSKYQELRGIIDPATGDLFVWDAALDYHYTMAQTLGIQLPDDDIYYAYTVVIKETGADEALALQQEVRSRVSKKPVKQAGSQSASVPDYLIDEWKTEQIYNNTDEEPYVNHDQRDYPYGMHDSPENTGSGIGWPKDNQPSVVHLDTLENPAFRNDPFGIGEYNVTYYISMPASDGIEKTNPE